MALEAAVEFTLLKCRSTVCAVRESQVAFSRKEE